MKSSKPKVGSEPYVYMADASGVNHSNSPMGAPKVSYENRKVSGEPGWIWGHQESNDAKNIEFKRQTQGTGEI